ncbi:MAG: choice-of-anchor C family protein [Luteolibacter sp.]
MGSDPDDPNSRPVGFVSNGVRVDALRESTGSEISGTAFRAASPGVLFLRQSAGADGSGNAAVIASPQVQVLRMESGSGGGLAGVIADPPVLFRRSDADFESGLEPFVAYSRASTRNWQAENRSGRNAAVIDNTGGDVAADDWLISPAKTIIADEKVVVNFDYFQQDADTLGAGASALRVMVSSNYVSGDPAAATWTDMTPPGLDSLSSGVWHDGREASITGLSGAGIRIAFRYRSSGTGAGQAKAVGIDNVYILEDFYQPPAITSFLANGVEISDGLELEEQATLAVTSDFLARASKAQFVYRRSGASTYQIIGEDSDFSNGAGVAWPLSGVGTGDYQLAGRLWSGTRYTEVVRDVKILNADMAGPVLTDLTWEGQTLANGTQLKNPGTFRIKASDPAGIARVDFFISRAGDQSLTLLGSDADVAEDYTCYWNIGQDISDGDFTFVVKAYDRLDNETSSTRTFQLVLNRPPAITAQPSDQAVASGASATFMVAVSGTPAPSLQWYQGASGDESKPIGGATGTTYVSPPVLATSRYWVKVSNSSGSAVGSVTATARIQLIANGSFEQPSVGGRLLSVYAPNSSAISGWNVVQGDIELCTGAEWQASEGTQSLDTSGVSAGAFHQDVVGLLPEGIYRLDFDISGNPALPSQVIKRLKVEAGSAVSEFEFDVTGHASNNMGWVRRSVTFVAESATTRIRFQSLTPGDRGAALDNVSLVLIEPPVAKVPPQITSQPASPTVPNGGKATLTVAATGYPAPTYQWYLGNKGDTGNPIEGATSDSLTTPALYTTTSYWVRAKNSEGSGDGGTAVVTVLGPVLRLESTTSELAEGAVVSGKLLIAVPMPADFVVSLGVTKTGRISFPSTLTIPAGQVSVPFTMQVLQNQNFEGAVNVTLIASSPGSSATVIPFRILDDDAPAIGFSLDQMEASENAGGQAVHGTLTLERVPLSQMNVTFTVEPDGQIQLPGSLLVPAGSQSVVIPVGILDNTALDGNRMISVTAHLLTGGETVSSSTPVQLTITDDEGPSLYLTFDRGVYLEGRNPAGTGTVRRSLQTTAPATVSLLAANPAKLVLPATVIIPAGQASVNFPIQTPADSVAQGNQLVQVAATSPGYNRTSVPVVVTDTQKPDLAVELVSPPAGALTDAWMDVGFSLSNQGALEAKGPFSQQIRLSTDAAIGSDALLGQVDFTGSLPAGAKIKQTLRVKLPRAAGRYWLVVETDANGKVDEILETNNAAIAAVPLEIEPAYSTTLLIVPDKLPAGTPVPITGTAMLKAGGPAAYALVNIHILNRGAERIISAITDTTGHFLTSFSPPSGQGGLFRFGSSHPGAATFAVQDEVHVYGLRATPGAPQIELTGEGEQTGSIVITNLAEFPLTGMKVSLSGVPEGVQFTAALASATLTGSGSMNLDYTISGNAPVEATFFTLAISSAEGASLSLPIALPTGVREPVLVAAPGQLTSGMVRGGQQFLRFNLRNTGRVASGPVNFRLPADAPWLRISTPQPLPPITAGGSTEVMVQLLPPATMALEEYTGQFLATDGTSTAVVTYNFRALSDQTGQLVVKAEDEYTYYAAGNPAVSGASVKVTDALSGATVATMVTDASGKADFGELREGYYEIDAVADRHTSFHATRLVVAGGNTEAKVFLPRDTVTYNWRVTPTTIEDRYKVTVQTEFETAVPIPVVTIEPAVIDLAEITGNEKVIDLKITNHGLISAEQPSLEFGENPLWKVTPLVPDPGSLPGMSSVTIPVRLERIPASPQVSLAKASMTAASGDPCRLEAGMKWWLLCGPDRHWYRIKLPFINLTGDCGIPWFGGGSSDGSGDGENPDDAADDDGDVSHDDGKNEGKYVDQNGTGKGSKSNPIVVSSNTSHTVTDMGCQACDEEALVKKECYKGSLAIDVSGEIKDLVKKLPPPFFVSEPEVTVDFSGELCDCCKDGKLGRSGTLEAGIVAKAAVGFGAGIKKAWSFDDVFGYDEVGLEVSAFAGPKLEIGGKGSISMEWKCQDVVPDICGEFSLDANLGPTIDVSCEIFAISDGKRWSGTGKGTMSVTVSGHVKWDGCENFKSKVCYGPVVETISISCELMSMDGEKKTFTISRSRYFSKGNCDDEPEAALASDASLAKSQMEFSSLDSELEQTEPYEITRPADYYLGPLGRFDGRTIAQVLGELPPPDGKGVCASVKLKLDQEAVLSRDAFNAELELSNSSTDPLENLHVDLKIKDRSGNSANDRFQVRLDQVTGMTGVNGGSLAANTTGTAKWVIVPTVDAASDQATEYLIGGTLGYKTGGTEVSVPFSEVAVTVLPAPRLNLRYFHQRDVFSDDPFTPQIEPAIPYSLAVMVMNEGAGVARNFSISSAQPTIIENEKGLLADFRIIATRVDGQPLQPSLVADFGDIQSGEVKIGEWLFTSSVQGLFTDYKASFEHIDGLGNPRLSLLDDVEIHEMIHKVQDPRATGGVQTAFLVNDVVDGHHFPDTIYLSDGTNAPVEVVETGVATGQSTKTLTAVIPEGWIYLRIPEPSDGMMELISVVRSDGRVIPLDVSVWVTDRTFIGQGQRPVLENKLHLLDHDSTGSYTLVYQAKPAQDTQAPESHVMSLAGNSAEEFPVSWTGTDNRGIAFHDIYVSTDAGPYVLWIQRSLETGAIFKGQLNHSYSFYSRATDAAGNLENAPAVADATTRVSLVNLAPVLPEIPTKVVTEGETLVLESGGTDPDGRTDLLTYSILTDVPPGLTINSRSGRIRWVTGEADDGREVTVTVKVTDSGAPSKSSTRTFLIRVLEDNSPPVLEPVDPQAVNATGILLVALKAVDSNIPKLTVQYRIVGTAPGGMTLDPVTGLLTWRPLPKDAGKTVLITVGAKNSGAPAAESTVSFPVTVDTAIPSARVNSLPAASTPDFAVSWRNTGNTPVASYSVYVSSDGGLTFTPWLINTIRTSAIFHGQVGKRYSFYVVAKSADGNLQPVDPAISSVSTVAETPIAANGFDEVLDFENNRLPTGWTINVSADQLGRTGVANKRFESRAAYTFSGLYCAKKLPAGATGFQIEYRGNISANLLGQSTQIRIYQKQGSLIQTYLGKASDGLKNIYAEAGLMDEPEYSKMFALQSGTYEIKAVFSDGNIVYSATKPGAAKALFDVSVKVPDLKVHDMYLMEIFADTSSPETSWFDDVVIKAIKPGLPMTYEIVASAKPQSKGTVTGARKYNEGKTVTLKAMPKKNGKFVSWTENGRVVSKKPVYTFKALKNRNLVANFQ